MSILTNSTRLGRTQKSLILKLIALFVSIQIVLMALVGVALWVVDGTRAYVAGSEYYAIGQKTAAYSILRYAMTEDPAEYERFLSYLDIPLGDRDAHAALAAGTLDWDAAQSGMLRGKNDASDIPSMILLYRLAGETFLMRPAIDIWKRGDRAIKELETAGAALHQAIASTAGSEEIDRILDRIHALDQQLTDLEFRFADAIGKAAHQTKMLAIAVLGTLTILLWGGAIGIGVRLALKADRAEIGLQQSERRFQDIADTAADWIWETNENGHFVYVSQQIENILDVDCRCIIGKSRESVLRSTDNLPGFHELDEAIGNHRSFRKIWLTHVTDTDERKTLAISGTPIFADDGIFKGYRGTGTDITDQVESEHAMQQAIVAAQEADQAKTMFLANMSHELRTPLNAIIGFSESMERQLFGTMNETYVEYARIVRRSGEHLLGMLSDLLDISRISQGVVQLHDEPVDVNDVVQDAVRDVVSAQLCDDRRVEMDICDSVPMMDADRIRVRQIVTNLITNAVKYSDDTTVVRISTALVDGHVEVNVEDKGIGIGEHDMKRIMEPFVQADSGLERRRQGAGLGLPLVKQLVDLHGGTFRLTSELGHGTRATVRFPKERILTREMLDLRSKCIEKLA